MPNYDKTDLTNTLNYIKSEYGISCFKDDKIIALLSDLAPSLKRERFLLKKFVDSGLMKEIAENAYTDETRQRQIIFKTHSFLVDEEFLQSDIVEQYLCILCKVLNYHTDFTKDMQILNQDTTLNLNSQKTISHENDNSLMSQIKSKSISIDVDFKNVIFNFCNNCRNGFMPCWKFYDGQS